MHLQMKPSAELLTKNGAEANSFKLTDPAYSQALSQNKIDRQADKKIRFQVKIC